MTGDILGITIQDDGWRAVVNVEGSLGLVGTFDFGWNADCSNETDAKFIIYVSTPGYSGTTPTNYTRAIYGTARIRLPWPDNATPDIVESLGNTQIKIGLSEYIFADDTILSIDVKSGFYTGTLASVTANVTNNSTMTYQKPVVNWSWPGHNRLTTSVCPCSVVGGHWSAENGKPIEAVEFILTDEHSNTTSQIVTEWTIDASKLGGVPFAECRADISISGFTDGDLVTKRFKAYPRFGTSAEIYDSSTDSPSGTTPNTFPSNQTDLYDTRANYGGVAVAASSAGASPQVYPEGTDPTTIPSSSYYGSGNAALVAIKTYNNALPNPHNDIGGGRVYLRNSVTDWSGASTSTTGASKTWVEFHSYPGDNTIISSRTGNSESGNEKMKFVGLEFSISGSVTIVSNNDEMWCDQCTFTSSGNGPFQSCKVIHVTRSILGGWTIGFTSYIATNMMYGIMRQNNGTACNGSIIAQTLIGNRIIFTGTKVIQNAKTAWGAPDPDLTVWYNNSFTWLASVSAPVIIGNDKPITLGMWIAQNIFEITFTDASITICASAFVSNNVMWWNNFIRGARSQFFYNENTNVLRSLCFAVNSIFDACGESTDLSAGTQNSNNVNDWSVRWRVGHSGCINKMATDFGSHNDPEFKGRRTYRPPNGSRSPVGWDQVINDQGWGNGGGLMGYGDYHFRSTSPVLNKNYRLRQVLPFDINCHPRGPSDPPGPYSFVWTVPRKKLNRFGRF